MKRNNLLLIYTFLILFLGFSGTAFAQSFPVSTIYQGGNMTKRINMVFLGDGYRASEMGKYITDVQTITTEFFNTVPFKNYKNYFNVYAIQVPSNESGTDHPKDAFDEGNLTQPLEIKDTYFSSTFDAGGIHRLLVPGDYTLIFQALADNMPTYDIVVMIVNSPYYGGSGGAVATTSLDWRAPRIAIHEIGHSFAFLGDEYSYGGGFAGECPNITADPTRATNTWNAWINATTPIPTPTTNTTDIGMFEGAGYQPMGYFRPKQNCKMRSLNVDFCAVCGETFVGRIHDESSPIDSYLPTQTALSNNDQSITFDLNLVLPQPNTLKINWYLNGVLYSQNTNPLTINFANLPHITYTLKADVIDTTSMVRKTTLINDTNSQQWIIKAGILPVEWLSFDLRKMNKTTAIAWKTASETNNSHFAIERKYKNQNQWQAIGTLKANAIGSQINTYQWKDETPQLGENFYRIKQIDTDGKFDYSKIKSIVFDDKRPFEIQIVSNPIADASLRLMVTNPEQMPYTIAINNIEGKVVYSKTMDRPWESTQEIDLKTLSSGIYNLQINNEEKIISHRFVKE